MTIQGFAYRSFRLIYLVKHTFDESSLNDVSEYTGSSYLVSLKETFKGVSGTLGWRSLFILLPLVLVQCCFIGAPVGEYPIYTLSALHVRYNLGDSYSPLHSEFIAQCLQVKVPLPQHDSVKNIDTRIGVVKSSDHFIFSVDAVNEAYSGKEAPFGYPYKAQHVELVTGPRSLGFRFSPLSLYFVYENIDDEEPSHYIMESGNGLGETKVLYKHCVPLDESFSELSQYEPTPFSDEKNTYVGSVSNMGRDPHTTSISSYHYRMEGEEYIRDEHPYHTVDVQYTEQKDTARISTLDKFPAKLMYNAACRIFALLEGFKLPSFPMGMFAEEGRKLSWVIKP